jgi:multiple sugar transport system permease protein
MWSVWAGVGSAIIIFMAGIKGVPNELMEAARIDGANSFNVFLNITLPLLTPLVFYQLIVGLIGSLQILTQPLLLTPRLLATETGAAGIATVPPQETYMFLIHIYQESFLRMRYGYGSALLWLLFLFILLLTFFVNFTTKYWVYYEVNPESQS